MIELYHYAFYKFYYFIGAGKHDDRANIGACTLLAWLLVENIYVALNLLNHKSNKVLVLGIFLSICIFNNFYFGDEKRCNSIFNKYKNENDEQRIRGSVGSILYIIISTSALFIIQ